MSTTHDVISALLDDEPFDPEELREALDDPAGRALLIDLVALRRIVQPGDVAPALVAPGAVRQRWWQLAAAAALLVAVAGGYAAGLRRGAGTSAASAAANSDRAGGAIYAYGRYSMKFTVPALAALLLAARIGAAQTPGEVQISVGMFDLAANGADKFAGGSFVIDSSKIGHAAIGVFSVRDCGAFSITVPPNSFAENAYAGWRVEVTPLKVVNHVVTFRLRWARALDTSTNGFEAPPREDIEVTLKPGESRPIDSVPVRQADAKTVDGKPCSTKATSLRVTADFPDMDRRLFGADLWLVERLPNGTEFVQAQSVRGLFNRSIPFYFDSKSDGAKRVDFFGKLVADPSHGGFEISIESTRAVANPEPEYGYQAARWFRSTIQVKPNEVVDIALPPLDAKDAPLADRKFSIRIKPRQIR